MPFLFQFQLNVSCNIMNNIVTENVMFILSDVLIPKSKKILFPDNR